MKRSKTKKWRTSAKQGAARRPPRPTCHMVGCRSPIRAKGLCNAHYVQSTRRAKAAPPAAPEPAAMKRLHVRARAETLRLLHVWAARQSPKASRYAAANRALELGAKLLK